MATIYDLKQGDTKPSLSAQLLSNGSAVDLTGATVKFHMGTTVDVSAVIVDAATGNVRYDPATAHTVTAGIFKAEFEVTFSDGTIETFPNDGFIYVRITEEVA